MNSVRVNSSSGHIPVLDGLRGAAILLVLLHHFAHGAHGNPLLSIFFQVNSAGWCGVDLFFVLSGFLITGILLDAKGGRGYFRNFYARRILRIFPLYYGSLLAVFVLAPLILNASTAAGGRQSLWLWFYVPNIHTVVYGTGCNPDNVLGVDFGNFWSLAVEEHFYFVWPFVIVLLSRRALMAACVAIFLGSGISRIVAAKIGVPLDVLYSLTIFRVDGLALGALAACLWRDPEWKRWMVDGSRWLLVITGVGLLLLFREAPGLDRANIWVHGVGFSWLALFFVAVLFSALSTSSGLCHIVMTSGVLRGLGKYSYGIYVYHSVMTMAFEKWFGLKILRPWLGSFTVAVVVQFLLASSISIGLAWLSWHLLESRLLPLKRYFEYQRPEDLSEKDRKSEIRDYGTKSLPVMVLADEEIHPAPMRGCQPAAGVFSADP